MPAFLMLAPAPVIETPGREVILDVAFVEGMKLHCQLWPGRVRCVLRRGAQQIAGGARFSPRKLGFDLIVIDRDQPVPDVLLEEAALVYCAADDLTNLHLPDAMRGRIARLVYTLEQPLKGRLMAALADRACLPGPRLRNALRVLRNEAALRAALSQANGVHFAGFPALAAYRRLNGQTMVCLRNRMRTPMLARAGDQRARADRLRAGAPLRLVYSGPLDGQSGVLDLLQMAALLRAQGMAFRLEIFGSGPHGARLQAGIEGLGLRDMVHLAGEAGFDAAVVPALRGDADLFVSPRRLSDPISSYIEAMGCGLPVLGYANDMWRSLHARSGAGWICRRGVVGALSQTLLRLDSDREAVIRASARALDYARANTFEAVFAQRMAHLWTIARLE